MLTTRDYVEAANSALSAEDLSSLLIRDMRAEGYDNLSFRRVKAGELLLIHCASLPTAFIEEYFANHFALDDPLVSKSLTSSSRFYWDDVEKSASLLPRQREVMHAFRDLGCLCGVSFPFHGPDGACDLVGLSQRHNTRLDSSRLDVIEQKIKYTRWRYWEMRQQSKKLAHVLPQGLSTKIHKRGPPEMMAQHCRALVFVSVASQRWQSGLKRFNENLLNYVSALDLEFLLSWGLIQEIPDDRHFYYYFAPTVLGANHLFSCSHVPDYRRQVWEMEVGHTTRVVP